MPLRPFLAFVFACASMAWPLVAKAEVRQCVTAGGQTIFTDRRCDEVDAVERLPRDQAQVVAQPRRAGGCARSLQDLVFAMSGAIEARDANRLAGVYHWPGTSTASGYRVWSRLDAVANRPLVDIVPVMAGSRPSPESTATAAGAVTSNDAAGAANPPVDPDLYPQTSVRRDPVALRVEQTIGASATPARTVFGLTHHFGCWWVRF